MFPTVGETIHYHEITSGKEGGCTCADGYGA